MYQQESESISRDLTDSFCRFKISFFGRKGREDPETENPMKSRSFSCYHD